MVMDSKVAVGSLDIGSYYVLQFQLLLDIYIDDGMSTKELKSTYLDTGKTFSSMLRTGTTFDHLRSKYLRFREQKRQLVGA